MSDLIDLMYPVGLVIGLSDLVSHVQVYLVTYIHYAVKFFLYAHTLEFYYTGFLVNEYLFVMIRNLISKVRRESPKLSYKSNHNVNNIFVYILPQCKHIFLPLIIE